MSKGCPSPFADNLSRIFTPFRLRAPFYNGFSAPSGVQGKLFSKQILSKQITMSNIQHTSKSVADIKARAKELLEGEKYEELLNVVHAQWSADQFYLYDRHKHKKPGDIQAKLTKGEKRMLYPGAFSKDKSKVWSKANDQEIDDAIAKWEDANPKIRDLMETLWDVTVTVTALMDQKLEDLKKEVKAETAANKQGVDKNAAEIEKIKASMLNDTETRREIVIHGREAWRTLRDHSPELKQAVVELLKPKCIRFELKVDDLAIVNKFGKDEKLLRHRVILKTEFLQQEILAEVDRDPQMKKFVKKGVNRLERWVNQYNYPREQAAIHYNYQLNGTEAKEFVTTRRGQDGLKSLIKLPATDPRVAHLLPKCMNKELIGPKNWKPEWAIYLQFN